ncbi:MAG: peptidyl-prolyl cis-trans isomerase [bacterium]
MTDKFDFSVPQTGPKNGPSQGGLYALAAVALVAVACNVVLAVALTRRPSTAGAPAAGALSAGARKDLALKLEQQGLPARATEAWKEYLAASSPGSEEAARILYRIGTLYQEAGDYDRALDSYYRSESHATVPELAQEINRRTAQCLESLGKFSALRYELDKRVGANADAQTAGSEVLAELGQRKITREELDRRIEDQIDRQLARFTAAMPAEERNKQKEAMFQRASSAAERLQALNAIVAEELLYRRAVELKLADDVKLRDTIRDIERSVLADQALRRELAEQIKITKGDVETWYEAHKGGYTTPARAQIAHILAKDEDAAKAVRKRLDGGEKFEDVAREISADKRTASNGGVVEGRVEKGVDVIQGVGRSPGAAEIIFATEEGKVCDRTIKTDGGVSVVKVLKVEPERQRPLDEVRQAVYGDLYAAKEREAQESLFERLKKQYNVTIHYSSFKPGEETQENVPAQK